jgi:hypothetical protein
MRDSRGSEAAVVIAGVVAAASIGVVRENLTWRDSARCMFVVASEAQYDGRGRCGSYDRKRMAVAWQ